MTDDQPGVPPRREPTSPPGVAPDDAAPVGAGSTGARAGTGARSADAGSTMPPGRGPGPGPRPSAGQDGRAANGVGPYGTGPYDTGSGATAADGPARPALRRGRDDDAVLAGVCHAAGRYFDVDPVIFRIVLAVLSLTGGIGLIVYGLGWLVVPQEGAEESEAQRLLSGRIEGAPLTAALMALVGCGLYASMVNDGASQAFSLLLVAATAGAVYWSRQRGRAQTAGEAASVAAGPAADAPPEPQAPPEPGTASWWREPLTKEPGYLWGPEDSAPAAGVNWAWRRSVRPSPPVRRDHGSGFGAVVFLVAAVAGALGTLGTWSSQPAPTSAEIGLASALAVFGCGYVVSSFAGRPQSGTRMWTLLAVAALVGTATLPKAGLGVGTSAWRPATAASVRPSYQRGAGTGRLDLRGLRLEGATVRTRLTVGAGRAEVLLPRHSRVRLVYRVGAAQVDLPDTKGRFTVDGSPRAGLDYEPPDGARPDGTVLVDVTLRAGLLEVAR
ncbi:PspC domain-containing protein [Actinacidiphila yeochonensis]|uniref:PspC domain-containing protein n=1 Tax=Actinacidiphila yeochonensis TaxID=89050 RepID=UPI000D1A8EAC|nr:PspC domain-containing protein [Actinacidiphila yeochonensis]